MEHNGTHSISFHPIPSNPSIFHSTQFRVYAMECEFIIQILLFYPYLYYIVSYISQIHLLHISSVKIIFYVYVFFFTKAGTFFSNDSFKTWNLVFPLVHCTIILSQICLVDEQSHEACWYENKSVHVFFLALFILQVLKYYKIECEKNLAIIFSNFFLVIICFR